MTLLDYIFFSGPLLVGYTSVLLKPWSTLSDKITCRPNVAKLFSQTMLTIDRQQPINKVIDCSELCDIVGICLGHVTYHKISDI